MKKLMLLVAVFMLGSTGIAFSQEPVKTEQPATEQTEDKKEEAKEEAPAQEETEEKAEEATAQSAE